MLVLNEALFELSQFFFTGGSIAYVYCFDISVFIQGKMLIMAKQGSQIELGIYRAFLLFNPEGSLRYQRKLDSGTAAHDKPPSASTSLRTGISCWCAAFKPWMSCHFAVIDGIRFQL